MIKIQIIILSLFIFIQYTFQYSKHLMEKKGCCPENSWPRLQTNYQPKGQKFQVANTTCYHIGSGNKVLVMVSDIWGAFSGSHEAFADTFSKLGYNVFLPQILTDPYVGDINSKLMGKCIKSQNFDLMKERFLGVTKYLEQKGHKHFFVISFCWGVWFAFKMATQIENIICIAGMHPALGLENMFGGDVNKLAEEIKCPVYLFPAGNDPENLKPHGEIVKILEKRFGSKKIGSHQFPEMTHGWMVRGDVKDPQVQRDVSKAIRMCNEYFELF